MKLTADFWNQRYIDEQTGWDIGFPSTPIKEFIDGLENKDIRILIPGCGNAHEATYLFDMGFSNVYVIDLAEAATEGFKKRNPNFPEEQVMLGNFFEHQGEYDLILEQTFFCAINPELRSKYAKKMNQLLHPKGKLAGVMFNFEEPWVKPPFGGNEQEYRGYFKPLFGSVNIKPCFNSIEPRQGSEYWVEISNPIK